MVTSVRLHDMHITHRSRAMWGSACAKISLSVICEKYEFALGLNGGCVFGE